MLGAEVVRGVASVGMQVTSKGDFEIGRIAALEINTKRVRVARAGQKTAVEISTGETSPVGYGTQWGVEDELMGTLLGRRTYWEGIASSSSVCVSSNT